MNTVAKQMKLAIVGATGFVGREVLKLLNESELLLVDPLLLVEKADDVGEMLTCQGADVQAHPLEDAAFEGLDAVLFCADPQTTKTYAPRALKAGVMVLDASGGLRESGVFLKSVEKLGDPDIFKEKGGFLPHPLATTLAMVLSRIHAHAPLQEVSVSTYQTVATAGFGAVEEVAAQSVGLLGGGVIEGGFSSDYFPHQAAFNVLPHVGDFLESGQTTDETSIATDFQMLMGHKIPLSVGCAYVPTFVGDGMDVRVRFESANAPCLEDIRGLFPPLTGVMVLDDLSKNEYATPYGAAETSYVFLSRLRQDAAFLNGLQMWLVADHIRVALARQLVQQAEALAHQLPK